MITLQERVHKAKPKDNWPLNKLHHVLTVRKGNKNKGMINDNLLSLSYGRIVNKNIDATGGLLPESFETYQIVQAGDIVMRLTDLQNDKRSIRQGLVKEKGIITSAYDAVYPKAGHDSRFWAYALLALDLAKYYYSLGGGVRQSIKFSHFPNDWIYTPPPETQKEIADFLDQETVRIDQLIKKKKELIEALDIRMDSKVNEVFKDLPTQRRLKNIANVQLSNVDKHIFEDEIQVTACHYTDVYYNDIITEETELRKGSVTPLEYKRFTLSGGEVIITKDSESTDDIGIPAFVGSTKENTVCGYHLSIITAFPKLADGGFIFWALKTKHVRDYFMLNAQGVTRYGLPLGKISDCPIPYTTDIQEQKGISDQLFCLRKTQLDTSEKIEASIQRLKEIKTSLITEAVTGQLDIEAWKNRNTVDRRLDKIEEEMAS